MAANDTPPTNDEKAQEAYEEQNVHEVYQQIAEHFSSTRYKVCMLMSYILNPSHSCISRGPSLNTSS